MTTYCPVTGEVTCRCATKTTKVNGLLVDVRSALRKLFTDHAVYTERYIEKFFCNNPTAKDTANRLLENQKDIGDFVAPIVGKQNGDMLTKLLTEHIMCAVAVLDALKKDPKSIDM